VVGAAKKAKGAGAARKRQFVSAPQAHAVLGDIASSDSDSASGSCKRRATRVARAPISPPTYSPTNASGSLSVSNARLERLSLNAPAK
jgi:hypothetical protein